jgi:pimeloyl-ACP methyl ester carboxylesterase
MRRRTVLASAALAALALAAPAAAKDRVYTCPGVSGFTCHRIDVPLDRTGAVPGTISLRFAVADGPRYKQALIALTGGPGQPGVAFGPSFQNELGSVLKHRRLIVLDQRGTGGSYALNCPEVQTIDSLQPIYPGDVGGCADRLGPGRDSFASIETAYDIDAIRQALGLDKLSMYGVSYGTWVEQQYARTFPTHVDHIVLDSVVPPGSDPYDLRIPEAFPRVMKAICAGGRCRGITADMYADLVAVVHRIQRSGPLKGFVFNANGGREPVSVSETDLLNILVSSDLNPFLMARLPAALVSARHGDEMPLLRLRHDAAGPSSGLADFSSGLFVATTCLDQDLPYSYSDPLDVRRQKADAALAAVPEQDFYPFSRPAIDVSSVPEICLQWPDGSFRPEATGPMPDVPTLIMSGTVDMRTSREGALALKSEIPHAQFLALSGSGHDVGDSDYTGCVDKGMRRFFADKAVGNPCKGKHVGATNAIVPPLSLAAVRPVPGLPLALGRVLRAATTTVADAAFSDDEAYYAGFDDYSGGGLRGGHYTALTTGAGDLLLLKNLQYVPGVVVNGNAVLSGTTLVAKIHVSAPGGIRGHLMLGRRVTGVLDGHHVSASQTLLNRTRVGATPPAQRPVQAFRLP